MSDLARLQMDEGRITNGTRQDSPGTLSGNVDEKKEDSPRSPRPSPPKSQRRPAPRPSRVRDDPIAYPEARRSCPRPTVPATCTRAGGRERRGSSRPRTSSSSSPSSLPRPMSSMWPTRSSWRIRASTTTTTTTTTPAVVVAAAVAVAAAGTRTSLAALLWTCSRRRPLRIPTSWTGASFFSILLRYNI